MKNFILLFLSLNLLFSAYYSPGMTMIDNHQNQSHPVCFGEADEGDPDFLRFADYNGARNGGDYHIIFVDMAASW